MHKIRNCLSIYPTYLTNNIGPRFIINKNDCQESKASDFNLLQCKEVAISKPKDTNDLVVYGSEKKATKSLRWGIAPVSLIAEEFVVALNSLPKNEHKVVGCAASYRSQAEEFAIKYKLPTIHTSFKSLAKCKDIDVVYVSPLNPYHLELSKLMIDNGKHVLCEMPMCLNEEQTIQLVGNAHLKRRFLMEAMWPRLTPAYQFIRQQIKDGKLGDVWQLNCSFGLPMLNVDRINKHSLGGGVTMNFGPHVFQLATWAFRKTPYKIHAVGKLNDEGVDVTTHIELDYGGGHLALICLSCEEEYANEALIKGSKGTLRVPNITEPIKVLDTEGKEQTFVPPDSKNECRLSMALGAAEVRNCLLNKKLQSDYFTHNESLINSRICAKIRQQLGVEYNCDKKKNITAVKN